MDRLISFGCSLTYGSGLEDCFISPKTAGPNPSKLVWPNLLADAMNKVCINNASPGSSNKKIWNFIVNFEYQKNDTVIILWSYPDRSSILCKDKVIDIGTWTGHDYYYQTMYDQHDSEVMSKLYVDHANKFLLSKSCQVYNLVISKNHIPILNFDDSQIDHIPVYIDIIRKKYPLALDKHHPGTECQEVFAKSILEYLGIKNNLKNHEPLNIIKKLSRSIEFMRNNQ